MRVLSIFDEIQIQNLVIVGFYGSQAHRLEQIFPLSRLYNYEINEYQNS